MIPGWTCTFFLPFTAPCVGCQHCTSFSPRRVWKKGTEVKDIQIAGLAVHFLPLPDFWCLRDGKHDTQRGNIVYQQWWGVNRSFSFSFFFFYFSRRPVIPFRHAHSLIICCHYPRGCQLRYQLFAPARHIYPTAQQHTFTVRLSPRYFNFFFFQSDTLSALSSFMLLFFAPPPQNHPVFTYSPASSFHLAVTTSVNHKCGLIINVAYTKVSLLLLYCDTSWQ